MQIPNEILSLREKRTGRTVRDILAAQQREYDRALPRIAKAADQTARRICTEANLKKTLP